MRKVNPTYKKQDLINMIIDWTATGIPQQQIIKNLVELEYSVVYSYQLIAEAKPLVNEALIDITRDRLAATIAKMEKMYMDTNDKKLKLEIQREINRISGLHYQKIDVTTNGKDINNIEVIKLIEIMPSNTDNQEVIKLPEEIKKLK
jgi:hypothetical protein